MKPFFANIGNLKPIDPFQGGNDKQRAHLNLLVDGYNSIVKLAAQCAGWDAAVALLDGMERRNKDVWVNGVLVTEAMLGQIIAVNA